MSEEKIKKLIIVLSILFVVLIIFIVIMIKQKGTDQQSNTNLVENIVDNSVNENQINTTPQDEISSDPWVREENKEYKKLEEVTDLYSYFLMKQCLANYYNSVVTELSFNTETKEKILNIIDKEAKETLNIDYNNILNLYDGFNNTEFCIDKIYKQELDENKDIYVVYHRLQKDSESNTTTQNTVILVKIDKKNSTFSIYPYEYLQTLNYLSLGQDDVIKIDNLDEITENNSNIYEFNVDLEDDQVSITEFYRRFKFDVQFDVEGLYSKINEEYKNLKFPTLEDFIQYINKNKEDILSNRIIKYEVNKYDDYRDYVVICKEEKPYIFSATNIMNYTILLDKYTVLTKKYADTYEQAFTGSQTKYCISRVIQAINDKNYEFVYQRLNPIQKNNYYRNIEDFKEFIVNNFYEVNNFEVDENYLEVSDKVYQYQVKVTDATGNEFTYKSFTMAVTVREDTDFYISIIN